MIKYCFFAVFSLMACRRAVVPGGTPSVMSEPECVTLTSCNASGELAGLLPQGPKGDKGDSVYIEDIVQIVLAQLPPGPKGDQGAPGQSVSVSEVVNAVTPLLQVGPTGPMGAPGQSVVGPRGPTGEPGTSKQTILTATRTYTWSTSTDFPDAVSVNSLTLLLPKSLKVLEGCQKKGLAYLKLGSTTCTYKGNDKNSNADALYTFVSCKNSSGQVVSMTPGMPFSFTGTVTLILGAGADTSSLTQVAAFVQMF